MRHGTTLALALGLGSGALVWHFTRRGKRSRPSPATASPSAPIASAAPAPVSAMPPASASIAAQPITSTAPPTSPASAGAPRPSPCALRLDAWGLRLDGAEVDIPTAVERCKPSGQADLTLEGNASAWLYAQLLAALGTAGVRINRWKV